MSLIFLVENEEQLHWMVLSTFFFFVENEFNICGFMFETTVDTVSKRRAMSM